jgi:hypothetical protein
VTLQANLAPVIPLPGLLIGAPGSGLGFAELPELGAETLAYEARSPANIARERAGWSPARASPSLRPRRHRTLACTIRFFFGI